MPQQKPRGSNGGPGQCVPVELPLDCDDRELFCKAAWDGISRTLCLSPRQTQIARLLLADKSDHEIAESLGLTWSTVRCHIQRLHEKIGAHSRLEVGTRIFKAYRDWRVDSHPSAGCLRTADLKGS